MDFNRKFYTEVPPIKRTISTMSGKVVVDHNRRTYIAENVDPTRAHLNIDYCYKPLEQVYHEMFDEALAAYNAKQKHKDRRIENYYEKIRESKQEKTFYEVVFQIGNMKDMGVGTENGDLAAEILNKFMLSFQERNPNLHAFSAHLHLDGRTPHLHVDFIPFTPGGKRALSKRVSLKQALAVIGKQIEHVQKQELAIENVEKIEPKSVPLSSKAMLDCSEYETLATAAKKYVTQEKKEKCLQKLLGAANQMISKLEQKIAELTSELARHKSVLGKLHTNELEQENKELCSKIQRYENIINQHNLQYIFRYNCSRKTIMEK